MITTYDGSEVVGGINIYIYDLDGSLLYSDSANNTSGSYNGMSPTNEYTLLFDAYNSNFPGKCHQWDTRIHTGVLSAGQITDVRNGKPSGNEISGWDLHGYPNEKYLTRDRFGTNHGTLIGESTHVPAQQGKLVDMHGNYLKVKPNTLYEGQKLDLNPYNALPSTMPAAYDVGGVTGENDIFVKRD